MICLMCMGLVLTTSLARVTTAPRSTKDETLERSGSVLEDGEVAYAQLPTSKVVGSNWTLGQAAVRQAMDGQLSVNGGWDS